MTSTRAWVSAVVLLTTVAGYAQTSQNSSNGNFITGAIAILGVLLAALLVVVAKIRGIIRQQVREDVDARLLDDESAFGKHRKDPLAHEPMRRQMMEEIRGDFAEVKRGIERVDVHVTGLHNRISEVVKPMIEQQAQTLKVMEAQMRRKPQSEVDE